MNQMRNSRITTFLVAGFFSFYNVFEFSSFNVLSQDLISGLQLSTTKLGFFSSCYLWANSIGLLFVGVLLDTYKLRRIMLVMICFSMIGCFGLAVSSAFSLSCFMRFLQGLASATSMLISMRIATTEFSKNSTTMIGIIIAMAVFGGISGNMIFSYVISCVNWRMGLLLLGCLGGILFVSGCLFFKPQIRKPPVIKGKFCIRDSMIVLNKFNVFSGLYLGLINMPVFVIASLWGGYFLGKTLNISSIQADCYSLLIFVGILVGSPIVGLLSKKFNNSWRLMCLGSVATVILSMGLLSIKTFPILIILPLFFLLGIAGCTQNLIYSILPSVNAQKVLSTATGFVCFVSNIVGAVAQIVFGGLVNFTMFHFNGGILFLIIGFTLGICMLKLCQFYFAQSNNITYGAKEFVIS